jgi:hypothetical protein
MARLFCFPRIKIVTQEELKQHQREQREKCLRAIVDSTENKKLIVAGAGTGKRTRSVKLSVDLLSDVETRDSFLDHPRLIESAASHCEQIEC